MATNSQAVRFAESMVKKGFPIGKKGAIQFAEFLLRYNPPSTLLPHLAEVANYINEKKSKDCFTRILKEVSKIIGKNPYYVVLLKRGRSEQWIYDTLVASGLPPAIRVYYANQKDRKHIERDVPKNGQILLFDDWAISGAHIIDTFMSVPQEKKTHVFLFSATEYALQDIKAHRFDTTIFTAIQEPITPLEAILTEEEIDFLDAMLQVTESDEDRSEERIGFQSVIYSSWFKTPDNIPDLFTGERKTLQGENVPPLIQTVLPPYETNPN